jgi:glycosyltransferase involved in cell wall biosynthesis
VAAIFARIEPVKGQDLVWKAMIELIQQDHDLHLLLIGGPTDGGFANELRGIAETHGVATRLHFAGWTNEPQRYYEAVDFAVNATLIPEGFGLSVVEAMLMGRPVLVHALGGPAETVIDGTTGWHVPEATVDAFAAALRQTMRDRSRWTEMGEAARIHALEKFSVSAFVSRVLQITAQTAPLSMRRP